MKKLMFILSFFISVFAYIPTEDYEKVTIKGYTVYLSPEVNQHKKEREQLIAALEEQFAKVDRIIGTSKIKQNLNVWVEWETLRTGSAAWYHSDKKWLEQNDYNPDKHKDLEIANTVAFINLIKARDTFIHELAHYFHDMIVKDGYENEEIKKVYQNAMNKGLYPDKVYANTNHKEYFAELTRAWLGRSTTLPHNVVELRIHDPQGYALVRKMWNIRRPEHEVIKFTNFYYNKKHDGGKQWVLSVFPTDRNPDFKKLMELYWTDAAKNYNFARWDLVPIKGEEGYFKLRNIFFKDKILEFDPDKGIQLVGDPGEKVTDHQKWKMWFFNSESKDESYNFRLTTKAQEAKNKWLDLSGKTFKLRWADRGNYWGQRWESLLSGKK